MVLTDRGLKRHVDGKTVEDLVRERDIPYHAMCNAYDLLDLAFRRDYPGRDRVRRIQNHYKKRGIHPLVF